MYKTSDVLFYHTTLKETFFVYTIFSLKDKKFYTGYTTDLERRLKEHNSGYSQSTKWRRPFLLIHYECFINKIDAEAREIFLKSGFGRKQLKESIKRTLVSLSLPAS